MAPVNIVGRALAKKSFQTFTVSHSTGYTSFAIHYVLMDYSHPLHQHHMRIESTRQKTGLWWHITSNSTSAKKSTLRTWMRRRLRSAFGGELENRGITETGTILSTSGIRTPAIRALLDKKENVTLSGSIRLQVQPAMLTARYDEVKQETSALLDILLECLEKELASNSRVRRIRPSIPRVEPTAHKKIRQEQFKFPR